MKRLTACAMLVLAAQSFISPAGAIASVTKRLPSDIAGVDLVVSCALAPFADDYVARTESGVALTSAYAVTRGADKGLVSLMNRGGKPVKSYVINHALMNARVTMKYATDLPEEVDLVFRKRGLALIHTSAANAGIFVMSDVYELPYRGRDVDRRLAWRLFGNDHSLMALLDLGLSFYRPRDTTCHAGASALSR